MPSKQVVDRQKEAQAVLSAGTTHAAEIVKRLEELFTPLLQRGEKLPDLELLVDLILRVVQQALTTMVDADDAYQQELLDDAEPRQRRDDAAAAMRQRLVDLRDTLGGLFGMATVQASGFGSATPQDPTLLSRFAGGVSQALSEVKLPQPRLPGLKLNVHEVRAELDKQRQTLDQALGDVSRETREAQAALSLRNTAQATYDERYASGADLLIDLLHLTGQHELADQVRLTWRRSPTEQAEAPSDSPDSPPAPQS